MNRDIGTEGPAHGPSAATQPPLATDHRGAGRRVVLVHGFTQTGRSWKPIAEPMTADYEVITVDLPGHGRSSCHPARDLSETAAALGQAGGKAIYVGYSLGGRVCLTLALEHPELVERLVLVGATPGIVDERERQDRVASDEALADRLDPPAGARAGIEIEAFVDEWLAGPLFAHLTPEQAGRAARLENRPRGLARSLRTAGAGTQEPSGHLLSRLTLAVLVVAGGNDEKFSAIATEMAAAIGDNAELVLVPGVGHAVPFEDPVAFLRHLCDFCARP